MLATPPRSGSHRLIFGAPTRSTCRLRRGSAVQAARGRETGGQELSDPTMRRRLCAAVGLLLTTRVRQRRVLAAEQADEKDLSQRLSPEAALRNPRLLWGDEEVAAYPGWLFGEWEISSRPLAFREPLGPRFLDDATRAGIREEFEGTEAAKPLKWKSRFYWQALDQTGEVRPRAPSFPSGLLLALPSLAASCLDKVVQYRAYNAGQEISAFLKQSVPRVVAEADPRVQPLQISVSFPVETEDEELIRSVTLKLEACRTQQVQETEFISSELFHQKIFTDGELDSEGDFEVLNAYTLLEPGRVAVRNRVAKYLIPADDLYKEADSRAVSWADYEWELRRLSTCIDTPYGQECATSQEGQGDGRC